MMSEPRITRMTQIARMGRSLTANGREGREWEDGTQIAQITRMIGHGITRKDTERRND